MLPLGDLLFDQRLSSAAMKVVYLSLGSDSVCPRVLAGGLCMWSGLEQCSERSTSSGEKWDGRGCIQC